MNRLATPFFLLTSFLLVAPTTAQPVSDWWAPVSPDDRYDRYDDRYDRDEYYDRRDEAYSRRGRAKRGGPPFCRSGAGHPVHGRAWCIEKGFASAPRHRRPRYRRGHPDTPRRWRRYEGTSIRFRISYERIRRWDDVLTGAELDIVLDRRTQRRLYDHRRTLGIRGDFEGRWVAARGSTTGRVLQLRAGRTPLAELADWDGDRRVDAAWLYEGGR